MLALRIVVNYSSKGLKSANQLQLRQQYSFTRALLSTSEPPQPPPTTDNDSPAKISQDGGQEELLYKMPQQFTIRTMLTITAVNTFYWSSLITNYVFFKGTMFGDIDLGGDPSWGYVGLAATGLFVYFTRHFAHHTVYQSYLSGDGRRVGFQVHNLFGNPGRKFEVPLGKAKFLDGTLSKDKVLNPQQLTGAKALLLGSSLLPVRVQGIQGNVLLDQGGLAQSHGKLVELLCEPEKVQVVDKEDRLEWRRSFHKQMKDRKKK